jgi:hypothetical protein
MTNNTWHVLENNIRVVRYTVCVFHIETSLGYYTPSVAEYYRLLQRHD